AEGVGEIDVADLAARRYIGHTHQTSLLLGRIIPAAAGGACARPAVRGPRAIGAHAASGDDAAGNSGSAPGRRRCRAAAPANRATETPAAAAASRDTAPPHRATR